MGPPGIQGTLRLGLKSSQHRPYEGQVPPNPALSPWSWEPKDSGPGSLDTVTGIGGWESLGFARPPKALAGFGTHWEQW